MEKKTASGNETVIVSASTKIGSSIQVWNPTTLSVLSSWKDCACAIGGLARVGSKGFVAAQSNRPAVQLRSWMKQESSKKSVTPERIGPMVATKDGHYIVAGGASGKMFIWEATEGYLLRVWEAHYKAVTRLRFDADDSVLFSAGEDGVVHGWDVLGLLDSFDREVVPTRTYQGHTLPVTDIHCSYGLSSGGTRLYTSSLDQTIRVFEATSASSALVVPCPSMLRVLTVDVGEQRLFAGGASGDIYVVDLHVAAAAQTATSIAGLAAGRGDSSSASAAVTPAALKGHKSPVTSLLTSFHGGQLISGDESGTVIVWDAVSRQQLRSFGGHVKMGAVASLIALPMRAFLSLRDGAQGSRTIPPLRKFCNLGNHVEGDVGEIDIGIGFVERVWCHKTSSEHDQDNRKCLSILVEGAACDAEKTADTSTEDVLKREIEEKASELTRWKKCTRQLLSATKGYLLSEEGENAASAIATKKRRAKEKGDSAAKRPRG
eukprot:g4498.t1